MGRETLPACAGELRLGRALQRLDLRILLGTFEAL